MWLLIIGRRQFLLQKLDTQERLILPKNFIEQNCLGYVSEIQIVGRYFCLK